jgi:hypothetical protein
MREIMSCDIDAGSGAPQPASSAAAAPMLPERLNANRKNIKASKREMRLKGFQPSVGRSSSNQSKALQ